MTVYGGPGPCMQWGAGVSVLGGRGQSGRQERLATYSEELSPVYTGIQILIQTGCVYTEAKWIQIQTQTTSPM